MKRILLTLAVLLVVYQSKAQTFSQRSSNEGFSVSLHLGYAGWGGEELDPFTGSGLGINFSPSYGFNERLMLFGSIELTPWAYLGPLVEASSRSTLLEFGARWMFGSSMSPWRPFLQAQFMGHSVAVNDDIDLLTFSGTGAGFGAGVKYFINPGLSLVSSVKIDFGTYTSVWFNDIKGDKELAFYTTRAFVGVCYNFN